MQKPLQPSVRRSWLAGSRGKIFDGRANQVREAARAELHFQLRADVRDGLVADTEVVRDLTVGVALRQQGEGLQLPWRHGAKTSLRCADSQQGNLRRDLMAEVGNATPHLVERLDQILWRRILQQVSGGTGLERT